MPRPGDIFDVDFGAVYTDAAAFNADIPGLARVGLAAVQIDVQGGVQRMWGATMPTPYPQNAATGEQLVAGVFFFRCKPSYTAARDASNQARQRFGSLGKGGERARAALTGRGRRRGSRALPQAPGPALGGPRGVGGWLCPFARGAGTARGSALPRLLQV